MSYFLEKLVIFPEMILLKPRKFSNDSGAGKSSFFNSVESVFTGHVTGRANAGLVSTSLTTQYRQYFVRDGEAVDSQNRSIKFRFCDSMGLEGEAGLKPIDFSKIMDGHVENLAEVSFLLCESLSTFVLLF